MTKAELSKILLILSTAYYNFDNPKDKKSIEYMIWHKLLKDLDFKVAQMAVEKLIVESPFPPTISDIRKQVANVRLVNHLSGAAAWQQVVSAIRHYGFYRESEAMESMDAVVAKTVRFMGWQELCLEKNIGVIRGQFLKMYQQLQEREKEKALLPTELKLDMHGLAEGYKQKQVDRLVAGKEC